MKILRRIVGNGRRYQASRVRELRESRDDLEPSHLTLSGGESTDDPHGKGGKARLCGSVA